MSETKFAELGRDRIAYQVLGGGPDLVSLTGTLSHVDVRRGDPHHAHFLRRLASFSRLILLEFVDRGSHQLKGVPGEWRLFAAGGGERP